MEKKVLTNEMIESGVSFNDAGFVFCHPGMKDLETAAVDLAERTVVLADNGVCYKNYRYNAIEAFIIAKYMTNIDTDPWDNDDGVYTIADYIIGAVPFGDYFLSETEVGNNVSMMRDIYKDVFDMLKVNHEQEHSLFYKLGEAFGAIINNGDILENAAHDRETTEQLIDLLGLLKEQKENKSPIPHSADGTPILNFSKKKKK